VRVGTLSDVTIYLRGACTSCAYSLQVMAVRGHSLQARWIERWSRGRGLLSSSLFLYAGLAGLARVTRARVLEPKMRNRGSIRAMKPVSVRRCRAPETAAYKAGRGGQLGGKRKRGGTELERLILRSQIRTPDSEFQIRLVGVSGLSNICSTKFG
jgi:hypothetical protein